MSDKKSVTKNDHFLKPCHEGQLGPPSVTNRRVFDKGGQLDPPLVAGTWTETKKMFLFHSIEFRIFNRIIHS